MTSDRILGLIFIAFGALALLSWLGGSIVIWLGALAVLFIALYVRQRAYGFIVAGSLLAGLTVGLLLGGSAGAILISLGVSFFVIDRLEPSLSHWAPYLAAALAALGLVMAMGQAGFLGSIWFALLLVIIGIFLLLRKQQPSWTYSRQASSRQASPPASVTIPTKPPKVQPAPPTVAEASPESEVSKNALRAEAADLENAGHATDEASQDEAIRDEASENGALKEAPPLEPEAQALYQRLERWRREQAAEDAKPAYIILTNESLLQIAREKPATLDELKTIKGIGPVKLERYGDAILALVREGAS